MKGRADEWSNQYTPIMEVAVIVFVVAVVLFDVLRRRPSIHPQRPTAPLRPRVPPASSPPPSSPRSFEVDLRDRER